MEVRRAVFLKYNTYQNKFYSLCCILFVYFQLTSSTILVLIPQLLCNFHVTLVTIQLQHFKLYS